LKLKNQHRYPTHLGGLGGNQSTQGIEKISQPCYEMFPMSVLIADKQNLAKGGHYVGQDQD
jgi:hypothetical protein